MRENIFKTIYKVERNGKTFFLHWKYRFDPIITPTTMAVAMGLGTAMSVAGTLKEGKRTEKIGEARAAIDIQSAEAARRASVEKARIQKERGRKLIEEQKGAAAAGGIRLGVGSPLVIEAQTRADITKDIGFALETGREEERFFRSRAGLERDIGKARKKRSVWDAIRTGLGGFATMGLKGQEAGWWLT